MKKFIRILSWTVFAILALLVVLWFSGGLGWFIANQVIPSYLPVKSQGFEVSKVVMSSSYATNCEGVLAVMSPERALKLARNSIDHGWLLPQGTFQDGMEITGSYSSKDLPSLGILPIRILVTSECKRPRLTVRLPVKVMNDLILKESGAKLSGKGDYVFGTYERTYLPIFQSFKLWSDDKQDGRFPITRMLNYEATGKVKYRVEDGPLEVKATAKIKEYKGNVRLDFTRDPDGVIMLYQFVIKRFKVNVENLISWGDDKIADELKRSMEKSINKQKLRNKVGGMRFPVFLPYDAEIDFLAAEQP